MKKFDLKKFLAENKATFHSSLREGDLMKSVGKGLEYEATEEMIRDYADRLLGAGVDDVEDLANYYLSHPEELPEPMEYEFFKNNFDDILSLAMTGLNEGKKSKKYYKDAEADDAEHIKALEKDMKDDKKASKKLKENLNTPTSVPELISQIQEKYPKTFDWLESELPPNPKFPDVKGTLEDNGYGKVYDEFMGGDMDDTMTDLNETNTKMKVSELKAKIKEMVLSEMELDVQDSAEEDSLYDPLSEADFLAELEGMLKESPMDDPRVEEIIQMLNDMDVDGETMEYILRQVGMEDQMASQLVRNKMELGSLNEDGGYEGSDDHFQDTIDESGLWPALRKFKDEGFSLEHVVGWIEANWYMINEADEKAAEEEAAADVTVDDTETTDVETTAEVNPNVKAVQDSLTQAQAAAQKLGDKKLIDQIGNTITFFTRTHVVEKPGTVAENKPIELPSTVTNQINAVVTNPATMAQQILNFFDKIASNEKIDFEANPDLKISLDKLRKLVKPLEKSQPTGTVAEMTDYDVNPNEIVYRFKTAADAKEHYKKSKEFVKNPFNERDPQIDYYYADIKYLEKKFPELEGTVAKIEALKERLLLQKKAGIISETQYKKKLEEIFSSQQIGDFIGNLGAKTVPAEPGDVIRIYFNRLKPAFEGEVTNDKKLKVQSLPTDWANDAYLKIKNGDILDFPKSIKLSSYVLIKPGKDRENNPVGGHVPSTSGIELIRKGKAKNVKEVLPPQ